MSNRHKAPTHANATPIHGLYMALTAILLCPFGFYHNHHTVIQYTIVTVYWSQARAPGLVLPCAVMCTHLEGSANGHLMCWHPSLRAPLAVTPRACTLHTRQTKIDNPVFVDYRGRRFIMSSWRPSQVHQPLLYKARERYTNIHLSSGCRTGRSESSSWN